MEGTNEATQTVADKAVSTSAAPATQSKAQKVKQAKANKAAKAKAKSAPKPKGATAPKKAKAPKTTSKAKAGAKPKPGSGEKLIDADLSHYVFDKERKTAGGHTSIHCGDNTAKKLVGKSLDEVFKIAASTLKEPEKELRAKYAHLNPGMQRMNLGNRIRAAL